LRRLRGPAEGLLEELQTMQPKEDVEIGGWSELCNWKCFVALYLMTMQVGTGIDMVTFYAPVIFEHITGGGSEQDNLLYTVFVGVVFVASTTLAVLAVDRVGRRPLLLAGSAGMTLTLGVLSLPVEIGGTANIVCILLFVFMCAFSLCPLAWVIPAEMAHSRIRAKLLGLGMVLNWAADYLVVSTFLSLSSALGQKGAFLFYAVINILTFIFFYLFVPETKGIALDH